LKRAPIALPLLRSDATKTARPPGPAKAQVRAFRNDQEMAELYRNAEIRLRLHKKTRKSKAGNPKSKLDARRQFHELQVHQVELEMQNTELQEARDRMEGLLEKYTDLYDFAPVGYLSLDETGVILEANLTGAALLGVERSRLINRRLPLLTAPANRPIVVAFLEKVFAGTGKQFCEAMLQREDGSSFWAGLHGTSALDIGSTRKWCRVAVSDITVLRDAEDLLRRNEALFSALIEQAPIGVYVVDSRFRLQQVNPRAQPVFSKVRPLIGRDLSEIHHILWPKRVADEVVKHFRHTLKTGKPYQSSEFAERRRDTGVEEIYEWQLQRVTLPAGEFGVVCFFSNITERKRTEITQRRVAVLAASNLKLEQEIVRRRTSEDALRKSEQHQRDLLAQSQQMQEQLRHLSRQVLQAQEEERKRISRELHDVIAQTLTGINVRLATLKKEADRNTKGLTRTIARTQRLVEKSVDIVHQFARELRPAVLDDLGLIPALHSFVKLFSQRTRIHVDLKVFAGVEQLDSNQRTILYRVAQEAINNVARHAEASRVEVSVQKLADGGTCMKIKDDGKSFSLAGILKAKGRKRLGLLGMRERLEMVGGNFQVESAPGQGTTITAQIPNGKPHGRAPMEATETKP
jgi:PAS domain S-box-containing protein